MCARSYAMCVLELERAQCNETQWMHIVNIGGGGGDVVVTMTVTVDAYNKLLSFFSILRRVCVTNFVIVMGYCA